MVVHNRLTRPDASEYVIDEREKLIEYRSATYSSRVVILGLFIAIFAMASGVEAFWVFNIIVLFYALAIATELTLKLIWLGKGA